MTYPAQIPAGFPYPAHIIQKGGDREITLDNTQRCIGWLEAAAIPTPTVVIRFRNITPRLQPAITFRGTGHQWTRKVGSWHAQLNPPAIDHLLDFCKQHGIRIHQSAWERVILPAWIAARETRQQ